MRNVLACDRILNWIIFDIDAITPCCEMAHQGELNLSLYDHKDYEDFIQRKIGLIKNINKNKNHICRKCYRLRHYETISHADFIPKILSLSFDKTCNIRCSYCFMASPELRKTLVRPAEHAARVRNKIIELFDNIPRNSLEHVGWTGGEPFLMPEFDVFYEKVISMKPNALMFATNLTQYKEVIRPQCAPQQIGIVCSLDAGTPETYQKIKGRDLFYTVIDNIKKYCSIEPKSVWIKYLFCEYNYKKNEIDSFFDSIKDTGVKKLRISYNDFASESPTKEQIEGMIYFINKAKEQNYSIDSVIRRSVKEVETLIPKSTSITV